MANTGCPDCRALVDQPQLTHHRAWHRSLDDALVRARSIADSATATADRALRAAEAAAEAVARLQAGSPAAARTAPQAARPAVGQPAGDYWAKLGHLADQADRTLELLERINDAITSR